MASSEAKYPFKSATLNDCKGDLSKRWYIQFYVWDVQQGKMIRKRFYEVNKFGTVKQRRNYARRMICEINDLLEEGYHFDINKTVETEPEQQESFTLTKAIQYALKVKKPAIRATPYPSYKSAVKRFQEWMNLNRISSMDIGHFDKLRAIYFDDYMVIDCGYSAKTINGNISGMKWQATEYAGKRGYGFQYDPVNRLTLADYGEYDNGWDDLPK
ncbi:MAG: hypothetical protein JSV24_07485, partial [Bacteroidales bacterium]